ncbi:MAG: Lrp/AsnC family transcriptional regulator [Acidimicrobiales bacterium]|nr:Lrp/AsnC family transcriptional regulator [Acidimicrobiales bacterium]
MDLDTIDRHILNQLQADAQLTNADLADRIGLSASACLRRVKRLEASGVVAGYVLLVEPLAIDRALDVFVEITLNSQSETVLDAFEQAVGECPEVMSCHLMAGDFDYQLHLAVADTADYERIHKQYLSRFPGVDRIRSAFAIRTVYATTKHVLETPAP